MSLWRYACAIRCPVLSSHARAVIRRCPTVTSGTTQARIARQQPQVPTPSSAESKADISAHSRTCDMRWAVLTVTDKAYDHTRAVSTTSLPLSRAPASPPLHRLPSYQQRHYRRARRSPTAQPGPISLGFEFRPHEKRPGLRLSQSRRGGSFQGIARGGGSFQGVAAVILGPTSVARAQQQLRLRHVPGSAGHVPGSDGHVLGPRGHIPPTGPGAGEEQRRALVCGAICLRRRYAMCGTEIAYVGARRLLLICSLSPLRLS
eukprot:560322-Rhodomonas_salina.1